MEKKNELKPVWVRLHLERQSESSFMPPSIVGMLSRETATAYVLTKLIEQVENEDYEVKNVTVDRHFHVSRTYVWACEVLGEEPSEETTPYNGEGGLG